MKNVIKDGDIEVYEPNNREPHRMVVVDVDGWRFVRLYQALPGDYIRLDVVSAASADDAANQPVDYVHDERVALLSARDKQHIMRAFDRFTWDAI